MTEIKLSEVFWYGAVDKMTISFFDFIGGWLKAITLDKRT
jgi:hypothetical protein